ncbi:Tudor domain-containing protein 7-like Protein [Tribolium castaneum]|uniref:Tudor domain-containing protein 7-like Protein n=1 Tax=Tribolium castaneum TaxID=7070 RepID=A0A139WMF3_TRICA|nr:Tudor domain-containing protein 7-like Protein [Tribolium castaneum]
MGSQQESEVKNIITGLLTSNPLRCTIQKLCKDFYETVGYNVPFRKLGFTNVEDYLHSIPDTVQVFGHGPSAEVQGVFKPKSAHINLMVVKQKNVPKTNRKQIVPKRKSLPRVDDGYRSRVPPGIQNNLRKLILRFPDGIWCTKLPEVYKKMFNVDLNYQIFHYRSLIEMCTDLTEIFHYTQISSDDYMLYDRNSVAPSLNQNDTVLQLSDKDNLAKAADWSLGSALIPSNIVPLSEEIPRYFPNTTTQGEYLEVTIGEIYDINNFWVYLHDGQLKKLMTDLQEHFQSQRNRYVISELFLQKGLYCVVLYSDFYHRGVIMDLWDTEPPSVKVLFIDYGSIGEIPCHHIWYLPKEFSKVPCQAIKASLYNIKSELDKNQCTRKFEHLISNKQLIAEVLKIDKKACVRLYLKLLVTFEL